MHLWPIITLPDEITSRLDRHELRVARTLEGFIATLEPIDGEDKGKRILAGAGETPKAALRDLVHHIWKMSPQ